MLFSISGKSAAAAASSTEVNGRSISAHELPPLSPLLSIPHFSGKGPSGRGCTCGSPPLRGMRP
jgi:hypothetical protein